MPLFDILIPELNTKVGIRAIDEASARNIADQLFCGRLPEFTKLEENTKHKSAKKALEILGEDK